MQVTRMSIQRARPRQKSCTECRRRRQKCNRRKDGPCEHCARRYPPVQCIMPEQPPRKPKIEAEVNFPDLQGSGGSGSQVKTPAVNESPYVSLHPSLPEEKHSNQTSRLKNILNAESESPSVSSLSTPSSLTDPDGYFEISQPQKTEPSDDISPSSDSNMMMIGYDFTGSPKGFGGVLTAINSLNSLSIQPSMRNAELFQLFHQHVIPNIVSVDGRGKIPALFLQEMLPWMIQSPLMPNIAILMASYTQALDQGFEVVKHSEPLSIKAHVLSLVNQFLKQDFTLVGGEALRAVIHLVIIEWFWGADVSLWAHMKGLKQMIKLRGGFEGMQDPLLVQVLVLTDYELACCFERDLYLQPLPSGNEDLLIPSSYPEKFSSPLLHFPTTFRQTRDELNLSLEAAEILDYMRSLTLSITSQFPTKTSTSKIQSTAKWIYKHFQNKIPNCIALSDTYIIFETIRLTAVVYSSCILSLTPFCSLRKSPLMREIYSNISQVSLTRWKEIPGILLWILLIAAPSSENDGQGRFLKKKMAVAGMSIGLEDFNLATGQLRAFWKVQRWIARESERTKEAIS